MHRHACLLPAQSATCSLSLYCLPTNLSSSTQQAHKRSAIASSFACAIYPPKGYSIIKLHAGSTCCLLWLASFLLYILLLWGARCSGTHPSPSKNKKGGKIPPSAPRGLCVSSCCAVPASCHANALQLWRWRLPRQVAAGDITGLQVSLLVGSLHVEM